MEKNTPRMKLVIKKLVLYLKIYEFIVPISVPPNIFQKLATNKTIPITGKHIIKSKIMFNTQYNHGGTPHINCNLVN